MHTKAQPHVNLVTLGCAKNLVDSENLLTQLRASGMEAEHEAPHRNGGVVIVNTCGFIASAKEESIDTILRYAEAKGEGKVEKLYVTGCLSERYREELMGEIPEVDAFFGTRELPALLKRLKADYKKNLVGERLTTTPAHYSYLKISEGCDRPCSFCAIPLMRGKHVSRPIEELVAEAEGLAARGTKELLLIAQDSTYYGLDLYGKRELAKLIESLADVKGIEWVRLHYAFPSGFPEDVLEVIARHPNVCNYLDIPLQHASTPVLQAMRRGITREKTEALLARIRAAVPNLSIRTTMLVGHPGETEEAFEELMAFVQEQEFDRLGVFTYSHEDGTHAGTMEDLIPEEVKEERAAALMELQEEISARKNQTKIGQQMRILVDRAEGGQWIARSEADSPEVDNEVLVDQSLCPDWQVGEMYQVTIVEAEPFDLYAVPADAQR